MVSAMSEAFGANFLSPAIVARDGRDDDIVIMLKANRIVDMNRSVNWIMETKNPCIDQRRSPLG